MKTFTIHMTNNQAKLFRALLLDLAAHVPDWNECYTELENASDIPASELVDKVREEIFGQL